ncbi:hypothetical protein [Salimicrobium halophilum]|uniref:Uncharacterized protein n=1 Tax=Salimicrobium halophilum TaxID=86666 RepID=A0A1G8WQF2_9BACI|nr:hypothetical protein [Salimicrobium halophilum]SDJ80618.1 hypothetical protein SAMN04490247_3294 [Salimicrobium halophilum]
MNNYQDVSMQQCQRMQNYHVMVHLRDGSSMDGIIVDVHQDGVTILIGEDVMVEDDHQRGDDERQWYGGGWQGPRPRPRRRARRFRRLFYPLAALAALSLFPYDNYPYYY